MCPFLQNIPVEGRLAEAYGIDPSTKRKCLKSGFKLLINEARACLKPNLLWHFLLASEVDSEVPAGLVSAFQLAATELSESLSEVLSSRFKTLKREKRDQLFVDAGVELPDGSHAAAQLLRDTVVQVTRDTVSQIDVAILAKIAYDHQKAVYRDATKASHEERDNEPQARSGGTMNKKHMAHVNLFRNGVRPMRSVNQTEKCNGGRASASGPAQPGGYDGGGGKGKADGGFGGGKGSLPFPCRHLRQGNCSYGDKCRFAHE